MRKKNCSHIHLKSSEHNKATNSETGNRTYCLKKYLQEEEKENNLQNVIYEKRTSKRQIRSLLRILMLYTFNGLQ